MFCSVEDWRRKRRGEIQEADCRDYHKWHTSQPGQNTALGRPQITIKSGSQAVRLLHKAFHSRGPAMLNVKTTSTKDSKSFIGAMPSGLGLDKELDSAAALCRIFAKNMLFIIKFDK